MTDRYFEVAGPDLWAECDHCHTRSVATVELGGAWICEECLQGALEALQVHRGGKTEGEADE